MSQLIQNGINTTQYLNAILRNKDLQAFGSYVSLREAGVNQYLFSKLPIFKNVILDLARSVDAEAITDAGIIIQEPGKGITLEAVPNRLILCIASEASFSEDEKRYIPKTGDLIWTSSTIKIDNHSGNLAVFLVLDFKEFLL